MQGLLFRCLRLFGYIHRLIVKTCPCACEISKAVLYRKEYRDKILFHFLLMLALIVISVMGIIKTYNGEWWKIPFIYEWSKKINL